ncbi:hypothetical protein DPMN_103117 [Dreissena polymorpha]|uniref:Sulfotransferase n=2 Tax=Dreissena polymorpha TaxID=45954 RepID=A0A9D4HAF4_DREPO|nr:hypothetical protein DPMN_103117 [Dreissena polymorpha]
MTSCRHERLDVLTLAANLQPLRKIFNKDVEAYFRCVDPIQRMGRRAQALFKRRKSPIEFIRTERIERCIPLLTNKCKQAKFRIWKFIRLTMNSAELFLKDYDDTSNVRIVHLVRDPRAMMDSQLRKNDLNVTVLSVFVSRTRYMCWRMMRDLKLLEDLKKRYPNVFYSLRYEDLVADPLKISRDLFRFIGMEFGNTDERYVRETSIDHRYNSTDRAVVWRRHIRQTHLDAVNDLCHEVYNNLGYVRLDDIDDVRDLNVKVHS